MWLPLNRCMRGLRGAIARLANQIIQISHRLLSECPLYLLLEVVIRQPIAALITVVVSLIRVFRMLPSAVKRCLVYAVSAKISQGNLNKMSTFIAKP